MLPILSRNNRVRLPAASQQCSAPWPSRLCLYALRKHTPSRQACVSGKGCVTPSRTTQGSNNLTVHQSLMFNTQPFKRSPGSSPACPKRSRNGHSGEKDRLHARYIHWVPPSIRFFVSSPNYAAYDLFKEKREPFAGLCTPYK